jgi:hypothetical protein
MPSLAELPDLKGFFSYSRRDDEHSQGSLSRLRAQIFNELRLQLGCDFKLFQDTVAIPEGTEWEDEIKRAISESVFFIPIVTPSSVASIHCRKEFEAFLDREQALGRKNLYVRVLALEKEELWRQDPLLAIIGRRQYFDWQKFRHRSFTEGEIAERIEQFCQNIVESLHQPWISPAERRAAEEVEAQREAERRRSEQELSRLQVKKAEEERRITEEAEKQSMVAQEERERQRQLAEKADLERRKATAAEVQGSTKSERPDGDERPELAPRTRPSKMGGVGSTIVLGGIALFCAIVLYLLMQTGPTYVPAPASPQVEPASASPQARAPDVSGCTSFRTSYGERGRSVMILSDDTPQGHSAAESAQRAAEQDGYTVLASAARRQYQAYLSLLQISGLIFFCGLPDASLLSALRSDNIIP